MPEETIVETLENIEEIQENTTGSNILARIAKAVAIASAIATLAYLGSRWLKLKKRRAVKDKAAANVEAPANDEAKVGIAEIDKNTDK